MWPGYRGGGRLVDDIGDCAQPGVLSGNGIWSSVRQAPQISDVDDKFLSHLV
jgi:hypothetical protein